MPREFCTYLDLQYLDRGLSLYESFVEHVPDFRLHAVVFDDLAHHVLTELELPSLEVVHASELEAFDPRLLATRVTRSQREYMWTATPCVIRFIRDRHGLDELTYLDADTRLFASPAPLLDALGEASVSLTPASSSPQHYSRLIARHTGLYVVQFMTFRFDPRGREILDWWRERCLEWCYERYSNGKMGDQKYLDYLPEMFGSIAMLGQPGVLGPWCIESRQVQCEPEGITVDGEPLLLYHFMGLRLYPGGRTRLAANRFRITSEQRRWIYDPYIAGLRAQHERITAIAPGYPAAVTQVEPLRWRIQSPISKAIGALVRARTRIAPHRNVGPYVPGGYVPDGYEADPAALRHDWHAV